MIRHFFLDKTNTIIQGSEYNMGLNPVLRLSYGGKIMRGLIHFDVEPFRELINDKTFANPEKLTFTLKMTNCFSVDNGYLEKGMTESAEYAIKRASSFDVILTKLPMHFDAGRGYDFVPDFWCENKESFIKKGSNWFCAKTGLLWNGELMPKTVKDVEGGVFTNSFLEEELMKFDDEKKAAVIGKQHFDFGNENLSIDITKYVFDVLKTSYDSNYGLCLSFAPIYEGIEDNILHSVHFFTDHTNTFFHPYIEVKYDEYIKDDRESFTIGRGNKLYLYTSDNGMAVNLDHLPTCEVEGEKINVTQSTKGVYCAVIGAESIKQSPNTIVYDLWSNIALNGVSHEDVEMEFVTNPVSRKFIAGPSSELKRDAVPTIYGINDEESVNQGEVREITVDFREKYMTHKKVLIDSAEYRLYVKDGNREFEVIPYHPIEKTFLNNFFMIYTEDLIPNQYYVDIKVNLGRETKFYKKALRFKIVNDVTDRYE